MVRIARDQPLRAHVQAELEVAQGRLTMATGGGIDHLPRQWTTFVHELSALDARGAALELQAAGASGWVIPGGYSGPARLSYRVDLSYAAAPWPPGNEQAGLWRDGALYTVTKPLFVTSEAPGPRRVVFDLPAGWKASTPWERSPAEGHAFHARDRRDLADNSIVLGTHEEHSFTHGPFSLTLALVGDIRGQSGVVAGVMGGVARHMAAVFRPRAPERYLVTLFRAEQDDGESFERSAAFTTATAPTTGNVMLWGNNLAHELYHIWIGGRARLSGEGNEWFDEGFTDYYADLALAQTGAIDAATFVRKAEKVLARYVYFTTAPAFPRLSMVEASPHKGKYRFGVYDAGWALAFCLDVRIQKATGGAKSLDDLMRALLEAGEKGQPATRARAFELAGAIAGTDLMPLLAGSVEGPAALPVRECLADAGLEGHFQPYAGELWITPREGASQGEQAVLRRLTGGLRQ